MIKGKEFDKNHFFLTNNISESINHILNSYFIKKYPTFNEWRNAILTEIEKNSSSKGYEIRRKDYITKILLYIFNSAKKNEEFDIFKIDKIKKINSIILPEHDSITISPLSELLNIDDLKEDNKNEIEKEENEEGLKISDSEEMRESEGDDNSRDDDNEENNKELESQHEYNLLGEINEKKDDNLDNLKFNLQHLLSENQFKDYENEIEKLLLEKEKKKNIKKGKK